MKVTIVGWYGTETIGDRGILAGIFSLLNKTYTGVEIKLGSLYPYFTDRTLAEDADFYKNEIATDIAVSIFNSKSSKELDAAIRWADVVMMGGGPLMHIHDLFMVEYAIRKASKLKKKTMLFGCGVGPMFGKMHTKALLRIVKSTDLIVLRDSHSRSYLQKLSGTLFDKISSRVFVAPDPSIEALMAYNDKNPAVATEEKYIAINLRAFPQEYLKNGSADEINKHLGTFMSGLKDLYQEEIRMIPMHYFFIGNDDRDFMNHLKFMEGNDHLYVQNEPLSLKDTMKVFQQAEFCIGMRFHSVVFQTLVNGKNFVLDYTEPGLGKIGGFLSSVSPDGFYQNRYVNLQESPEKILDIFKKSDPLQQFTPDKNSMRAELDNYISLMKSHL